MEKQERTGWRRKGARPGFKGLRHASWPSFRGENCTEKTLLHEAGPGKTGHGMKTGPGAWLALDSRAFFTKKSRLHGEGPALGSRACSLLRVAGRGGGSEGPYRFHQWMKARPGNLRPGPWGTRRPCYRGADPQTAGDVSY
ncbi:unnamed protein product [Arctogadus glacialis]